MFIEISINLNFKRKLLINCHFNIHVYLLKFSEKSINIRSYKYQLMFE